MAYQYCLPSLVAAQEAVVRDDAHAVAKEMLKVKEMLDNLVPIFHKISVNAENEDFYVDPIVWGKTVATLHSPIDPPNNTPGASGLYVPMFTLDEWFGSENIFIRIEKLRSPFVVSIELARLYTGYWPSGIFDSTIRLSHRKAAPCK